VRVGAVVKMLVRDFEDGDNAWLVQTCMTDAVG
jgi:hypothetical protein